MDGSANFATFLKFKVVTNLPFLSWRAKSKICKVQGILRLFTLWFIQKLIVLLLWDFIISHWPFKFLLHRYFIELEKPDCNMIMSRHHVFKFPTWNFLIWIFVIRKNLILIYKSLNICFQGGVWGILLWDQVSMISFTVLKSREVNFLI